MVINSTILFFIGRILRFIYCVLFIDGNNKYIFEMAKIHRCYNGTCFCQVVGILLDLTDITDKQSFYIFFTDVGCDNTFAYSYLVVLNPGSSDSSSYAYTTHNCIVSHYRQDCF